MNLGIPSSDSTDSYGTDLPLTENPICEGGNRINGNAVGLDGIHVQSIHGRAHAAVYVGGYKVSRIVPRVLTSPSDSTGTHGQPGVGSWPTVRGGGVTPANHGWKTFPGGKPVSERLDG
jgi:hypothetical protein